MTIALVLVSLHKADLLHQFLLLLRHLIDTLDEVDVILHETGVVLSVLLQAARQLSTVVANVLLMNLASTSVLIGLFKVGLLLLAVALFEYPSFVKADDTFLQLLVVLDVLNNLEDVVLEAPLLE